MQNTPYTPGRVTAHLPGREKLRCTGLGAIRISYSLLAMRYGRLLVSRIQAKRC